MALWNEHHFWFFCSAWDDFRNPFLAKCKEVNPEFDSLDDVEQFRFVMNEELIQLHTAEFVCNAYYTRKNLSQI